jgi:hypothetical protein
MDQRGTVNPNRDERRDRLRRLDACLDVLEDAHLRGEVEVSTWVAARVRAYAASVTAGMPVADAIEEVFSAQEPCLTGFRPDAAMARPRGAGPASPQVGEAAADHLNEAGARDLTERIRLATRHVCTLLMEAHDRRAWLALGYRSWEQYVKREFGLSRSRSYELLDQGQVIVELQLAAGTSEFPDISAYAAAQIKHQLAEVAAHVSERTRGQPAERVLEIISEVVQQQRKCLRNVRRRSQDGTGEARLRAALDCLAGMPDATLTAGQLRERADEMLTTAEPALLWLSDLVAELRPRARVDALRERSRAGREYAVGA